MVDAQPCLSDLRKTENGRISYLVPQASFIDSLQYGLRTLINQQRVEFINNAAYIIEGSKLSFLFVLFGPYFFKAPFRPY